MKYGMRERLSGAVILIALAVIFVPLLFDEPATRSERPAPTLTIEQPVEVERHDVPDPEPPQSLESGGPPADDPSVKESAEPEATPDPPLEATSESTPEVTPADPIAELARAADQRLARQEGGRTDEDASSVSSGDWVVQVGSFAQAENAARLEAELTELGFHAFRRPRDNDLTSVYVGPFTTAEAGEQALDEVKAKANLQGLLVRAQE